MTDPLRVNPQARRIADDALGVFRESFGPFAAERYEAAYGPDWQRERGFTGSGIGARAKNINDPLELLSRLQASPEFDKVFSDRLDVAPVTVFRLAREIKDGRNAVVHYNRAWEAADAWQMVSGLGSLLVAFGLRTPEAAARLDVLEREAAAIVAGHDAGDLQRLRREYVEGVLARTAHLDSGGISARVASRIVQVRLEDVYVEPHLIEPADGDQANPRSVDDLLLARRAVVVGGPGAGKSTLLRRIARSLLVRAANGGQAGTPIDLGAALLGEALAAEPGLSLRRYLTQRATDRFGNLFEAELQLGRAVVLVDGLDEVADETMRAAVATVIGRFTHEYPSVTLIATTRPVGFHQPASWASFERLDIAPFDDEQVASFVERWGAILAGADVELDPAELVADIEASHGVRELAGSPLLLTVLVLLWHRGARLPERLAELYELATTTLLHDWPTRRMGRSFDHRLVLGLLQPIALELAESGASSIDDGALLERWQNDFVAMEAVPSIAARARAQELVQIVEERTGFFVELGNAAGSRQYGFIHRSFMEYLAARELAEAWDAGDLDLARYVHLTRWQHIVDFLAGHIASRGQAAASRFAEAVISLSGPSEEYLRRNVPLVIRWVQEGLQLRPALRDAVLTRAIEQILDPALEPLRSWRAPSVATVASLASRSVSAPLIAVREGDDAALRARKAWLGLLIDPDSDECLGEFLRAMPGLVGAALDEEEDIQVAMRAIGVEPVHGEAEGVLLSMGSVWFAADPDAVERLGAAGVRTVELTEIATGAVGRSYNLPWMVDPDCFERATVDDVKGMAASDQDYWPVLVQLVGNTDWHEERVADIEALVARPEELPAGLAAFATLASEAIDAGRARGAWQSVVRSMITDGNQECRQVALVLVVANSPAFAADLPELVALAVDKDSVSARAIPIGLAQAMGDAPDWAIPIAEEIAASGKDPVARGLARCFLAITSHLGQPLTILSSPDVAISADDLVGPSSWWFVGDILSMLLMEEGGEEAQAAAAEIARQIATVGPYHFADLGMGQSVFRPDFDRIARELSEAPRAPTRAWAAAMLASLDRGPATEELARLLADPDPDVRSGAFNAVQDIDLRESRWLEDMILRFFEVERGEEAEFLPVMLTERLPDPALEDLVLLAETYLDANPGVPGAIIFLDAARRRGIGRPEVGGVGPGV